MGKLTNADHRDSPSELDVRKMTGEVDNHSAAGSTGQAEAHRHERGQCRSFEMIDELLQRDLHRPVASVIGVRIDAFGDDTRECSPALGMLSLCGT